MNAAVSIFTILMPLIALFVWLANRDEKTYFILTTVSNFTLILYCCFLFDGLARLVRLLKNQGDHIVLKHMIVLNILAYLSIVIIDAFQSIAASTDSPHYSTVTIVYLLIYFASDMIMILIVNKIVEKILKQQPSQSDVTASMASNATYQTSEIVESIISDQEEVKGIEDDDSGTKLRGSLNRDLLVR